MNLFICAPNWDHRVGGVRVLHYLAYIASKLGHVVFLPENTTRNPAWGNYAALGDIGPTDQITMVVPEVNAASEPIPWTRIVRWVLYFPGVLGGPPEYPAHEMVATFLPDYRKAAQEAAPGRPVYDFFLPCVDIPETPPTERYLGALYWQHKGPAIPPPEAAIEITRSWPPTRKELFALLRSSRRFYCADAFSALAQEAQLAGCEVFILDGFKWVKAGDLQASDYLQDDEKAMATVAAFLAQVDKHFGDS